VANYPIRSGVSVWRLVSRLSFSIILFGLTMEVCARIDDKINYDAPLLGSYDSTLLRKSDSEGIRHNVPNSRFEKWKINKFGFRGDEISLEKPRGMKRIACMGTSESFGLYEDSGKEWPAQLNDLLSPSGKFQVINTSVVGLGIEYFKPYLEKYVLKFEPDLVILYINPYFYISQVGKNPQKTSKPKMEEARQPISEGLTLKSLRIDLRIFPKIKQAFKQIVPPRVLKRFQIWSMSREVQALEKHHLNGTKPIDVIPESYLNSFKNDLNDIILFLSSKGVGVILSSYPVLISKTNLGEYLEIFLDNRRFCIELSFEGMIKAPKQFNSIIQSIANEGGAGYVDNFNGMPKEIKCFGDNVHYTNEGARIIASNFAKYILTH